MDSSEATATCGGFTGDHVFKLDQLSCDFKADKCTLFLEMGNPNANGGAEIVEGCSWLTPCGTLLLAYTLGGALWCA
jgi:hypothetical protein